MKLPLFGLLWALAAGCAATPPPPAAAPLTRAQEAPEPSEKEEERNTLGLFLGVTDKDGETAGSVGVKYERHLDERYGLGVILEFTPVLQERFVTLPALFVHPWRELSVTLAPGFQNEDSETSFVLRTGVGWDFELGRSFSLAPELNYDFVEGGENAVVLGLTLGYSF